MTEDEIVEYATSSPENTNPAVLRDMLSQLSGGGSGGGGTLFCNLIEDNYPRTLDKTYGEIWNAVMSGKNIMMVETTTIGEEKTQIYTLSRIEKYEYEGEKYSLFFNDLSWTFIPGGEENDYPIEDLG